MTAAPDALELSVVNGTGAGSDSDSGQDSGQGPAQGPGAFATSGHGLPGLAGRVRLLHGELEAGPDGPRHWRLAVRLPVRLSA